MTIINQLEGDYERGESSTLMVGSSVLNYGGLDIVVYSFLKDMFGSVQSVIRYNESLTPTTLALNPTFFPKEKALGISLSLSF